MAEPAYRDRSARIHVRAVAKLTGGVVSPALDEGPGHAERAHVVMAHGDLNRVMDAVDRHRRAVIRGRTVAQLAEHVVTPAEDVSVRRSAHVLP